MLKIILTKGLPGSGKSTWAKEFIKEQSAQGDLWKRINKDDLRAMFDNSIWSKQNEKFIIEARDALVMKALDHGCNVIVDDTNLSEDHLQRMLSIAIHRHEYFDQEVAVEVKDFTHVSLDECLARDAKRQNYVGEKVIKRMYNKYLKPVPVPQPYIPSLPDAIICDLDGTVALLNGRDPYNASTADKDTLNSSVAEIIKVYAIVNCDIEKAGMKQTQFIFMSGREDKYRDPSEAFLKQHFPTIEYSLFMRPTGDSRKDSIVKQELYEKHIKGQFNVAFVLDDRTQVVEMWRSNGLTCLQVADGDF